MSTGKKGLSRERMYLKSKVQVYGAKSHATNNTSHRDSYMQRTGCCGADDRVYIPGKADRQHGSGQRFVSNAIFALGRIFGRNADRADAHVRREQLESG